MHFGFHGRCGDNPRGRHAMRGQGGRARDDHRWSGGRGDGTGGRGGGRRGRLFDGGELRLVLLSLIGDEPRHGYDLIRAIEERSGGAYAPSPGVVYPTLTMLGDMEQIAETPREGNRKVFAVTDAGRATLIEKAAELAVLFERLDAVALVAARTEDGPIRRAFLNLRHAAQNTMRTGGTDAAHEIAAILDEAAQRIERL